MSCPQAWAWWLLAKLPVRERVGSKVLPIPTKSRSPFRGRTEALGEQQEPPRIHAGEVSVAQTYQRFQLEADVLLPVPLHPARQRLRGFNQALLLARVCSRLTGVPVNEELIRQRPTQAQVSLTGRSRQQNMMGAFLYVSTAATPGVANRKILIIDDVCTTGATLDACARPLFAAGARSVTGLVLASAWHRT
nr:phosphoribosyltransferase family protein [Ktedonobacter racemifer]